MTSAELLERDGVIEAVERLISQVAAGDGGAVCIVGEAGLGKTALLDHACRAAVKAGLTVGFARGHPMEVHLPFGLVAGALEGIGGGRLLSEDGGAPMAAERSSRYYSVLRWLQGQSGGGLILAIDDLHWGDADSLALVSFLCRRMAAMPVGLIASVRPWPPEAAAAVADLVHEGCAKASRLQPLSEASAAILLRERLGRQVPDAVRAWAFILCAGNPLLLEQLAITLASGEVPAGPGRSGPVVSSQDLLLARFAGLPAEGMRCAQAAAVLGGTFLPLVAADVAGLDRVQADKALDALSASGLIEQHDGAAASFTHPLFQQALYEDLGGPPRARLHARAFAVLHACGKDAQAAEHAVQAHLAGDPAAIAVLDRAGRDARRAGALATAVQRFSEAVALAGDLAGAALLLAYGEAVLAGGRPAQALAVFERVLARADIGIPAQVEAMRMLGRALVLTGAHDRATTTFEEAAKLAGDGESPVRATEILLDSALASWLTAGPARALPLASRALRLAQSAADGSGAGQAGLRRAEAAWGFVALQSGLAAGVDVAERAVPWLSSGADLDVADVGGAWGATNCFAHAACLAERFGEAERAFAVGQDLADRLGAVEAVAVLASGRAFALTRMGRLGEAFEAISYALSFADMVPLIDSFAGVGSAYIDLLMGRLDESAASCGRVEATATARGEWNALLFVWEVIGHRRLREGELDGACELYRRVESTVQRMGIGEPCLPPWGRHAVMAHVAAGQLADAKRVVDWLGRCASGLPCRYPRIAHATGQALLAQAAGRTDEATAAFDRAMALHAEVDLPVEHAETLLGYGVLLRESGAPARARPLLSQAVAVAEQAGASWLAGHARAELKVAGGRMRRRPEPGALTPQEERVAAVVTTGASNGEVARRLHLSVSTVETHLERIYAKLDIHSRYELIARSASAPDQHLGG